MITLWEHVRQGDSTAVRRALREADLVWRSGENLERAVLWMERAAAFSQEEGDRDRALELAAHALELSREVQRRSGMPERSDPAWLEARRIQSSLIEVRDSWLDPVEQKPEAVVRPQMDTLPEVDVVDATWTAPWEEPPTLPRTVLPPSKRDRIRPVLGSLTEQVLLLDLAGSAGPGVVVQPPSREDAEQSWGDVRGRIDGCPEFEDTPDRKLDALLNTGSVLRLGDRAALTGWDVGVVLEGKVGLFQRGLVSHRIDEGSSFSCTGSVPGAMVQMAALQPNTWVVAWDRSMLESILDTCPWVLESLRDRADELLTLAAIPLGSVARYLGQAFVQSLVEASRVVVLAPGTLLFEPPTEVHALHIVGVGDIELVDGDGEVGRAARGQVLFARELVTGAAAPTTARVGKAGATVLHTEAVALSRFLPHVPLLVRALAEVA